MVVGQEVGDSIQATAGFFSLHQLTYTISALCLSTKLFLYVYAIDHFLDPIVILTSFPFRRLVLRIIWSHYVRCFGPQRKLPKNKEITTNINFTLQHKLNWWTINIKCRVLCFQQKQERCVRTLAWVSTIVTLLFQRPQRRGQSQGLALWWYSLASLQLRCT